jgi:hypothetical protein
MQFKKLLFVLSLGAFLAVQGCLAAAVGYGAYKMSGAKTESAEKAQRSADLKTYATYRVDMEKVNLEREKFGLQPNPIMTQEEWIGAQTAGRPAIAPSPPAPAEASPVAEKKNNP